MIKRLLTVWQTELTWKVSFYEFFRRNLDTRSRAKRMFLLADNDAAIRRALLRKSQPHPGNFVVGQNREMSLDAER